MFSLLTAPGPVVLESILSDSGDANDYSFLSFAPAAALKFSEVTELRAGYAFTLGNCAGGSLRWSVRIDVNGDGTADGAVFIYYGDTPNFTDCTTNSQSGVNMIGQLDLRYDTSQLGGTFYDSYTGALALVGDKPVIRASLVLDSGWVADQKLTLGNVTVNDNTFVPASGPPTQTCDLPPATIQITKVSPATLPVTDAASIQPSDDDLLFRVVDCKYMYNLAANSLEGSGIYKVEAVIGGTPVPGAAYFGLR